MAFLTKKEQTLINMINAASIDGNEKSKSIKQITNNARLRQVQYRKPIKIFLSVMSGYLNEKIAYTTKK